MGTDSLTYWKTKTMLMVRTTTESNPIMTFCTNPFLREKIIIPKSLQTYGVYIYHFKLRLFYLTKFIVCNNWVGCKDIGVRKSEFVTKTQFFWIDKFWVKFWNLFRTSLSWRLIWKKVFWGRILRILAAVQIWDAAQIWLVPLRILFNVSRFKPALN